MEPALPDTHEISWKHLNKKSLLKLLYEIELHYTAYNLQIHYVDNILT